MEDAIASLEVGGVSSPVTDAGTHFILVKSRSAVEQVPDDLLRAKSSESAGCRLSAISIAVDQLQISSSPQAVWRLLPNNWASQ